MAKRRYHRRGRYRMTPARKVALRKAQMISARKRKGHGLQSRVSAHVSRNRGKYIAAGTGTAVLAGAIARHRLTGSKFITGVKSPVTMKTSVTAKGPAVRFDSHGMRVGKATQIVTGSTPVGKAGFRVHSHGRGSASFVYTHRSGGVDRTYGYTHNSLRSAMFGKRQKTKLKRLGVIDAAVPGGLKYKGGHLVTDDPRGILAGAAGSAPSRAVGWGKYPRTLNRKPPSVNVDAFIRNMNKRYGL